jgi:hypothetical protein
VYVPIGFDVEEYISLYTTKLWRHPLDLAPLLSISINHHQQPTTKAFAQTINNLFVLHAKFVACFNGFFS